MPSQTEPTRTYLRRAWRLRVPNDEEAFVEFDLVGEPHWRLDLVEVSEVGVGFRLEGGRPSLAVGTPIAGVMIHAAGLRIAGSIRVAHVTPKPADDTICGAVFVPSTETDMQAMGRLMSHLEKHNLQSS